MKESEMRICDAILKEGIIEREEENICGGVIVKQYTVSYAGCRYEIVKNNGELVYIRRNWTVEEEK